MEPKIIYNKKSFGSSTFDLRPSTFDLRPSTFDLYYVLRPAKRLANAGFDLYLGFALAPRVCGVDLIICYFTSLKEVFRFSFPFYHSFSFLAIPLALIFYILSILAVIFQNFTPLTQFQHQYTYEKNCFYHAFGCFNFLSS